MSRSVTKRRTTRLVTEMVFTLLTIPIALSYVEDAIIQADVADEMQGLLFLFFFFMAIASLFRAMRMKADGKPKANYVLKLIHAAAFLVCAALPLFIGFTLDTCEYPLGTEVGYAGDVRQIVCPIYWGVLISGRVLSVAQHRKWYWIVLNVAVVLLIVPFAFDSAIAPIAFVTMFTQAILSLGAIMAVTFARMRLDVLKKIIRKTYAAEIIFGLLLLIASFSYVFSFVEEGINTFTDGLWYCFAIVTTIGFGDISATSPAGRILSVILGIYGIIVVALITSIIVNFYGEMKKTGDDGEGERIAIEDGEEADAE